MESKEVKEFLLNKESEDNIQFLKELKKEDEIENNALHSTHINKNNITHLEHRNDIDMSAVNWKGLYEDGKVAWLTLLIFLMWLMILLWNLNRNGYFAEKVIKTETEIVTILNINSNNNILNQQVSLTSFNDIMNNPIEYVKLLNQHFNQWSHVGNTKLIIEGKFNNNTPITVEINKQCPISQKWVNKKIPIEVVTKYKQYSNSKQYDLEKIDQLCGK